MKITLNNRKEEIDCDSMTIQELINYKKFTFKLLVTKLDGKLVKKEDRATTKITDGDNVVVLHMVSGG